MSQVNATAELSAAPQDWLNIRQASVWASQHLNKTITPSNISYLIQYGRIKKYAVDGKIAINKVELAEYYQGFYSRRAMLWQQQLGQDLNWHLAFDGLKESDTTKHVHRLHPYKGKFIPQLVEYFLDERIDTAKTESYFRANDVIFDPFCGSGTTLVQASELGLHAVGVDVSAFNALISNVKLAKHEFVKLTDELDKIDQLLAHRLMMSQTVRFEQELSVELAQFNRQHFAGSKHQPGGLDQRYGIAKEQEFLRVYAALKHQHHVQVEVVEGAYLNKWYLAPVRADLKAISAYIATVHGSVQNVLRVILSRTARSCRATQHADLGTLKQPTIAPYYCRKHRKICKPIFSIHYWWQRYVRDTLARLKTFDQLRTNTHQICLVGQAENLDLKVELSARQHPLADLIANQGIRGIFTSPPYVGLIDYHEQHAYAYDLFGLKRNDAMEIGSLAKGTGKQAQAAYCQSVAQVLRNCKPYLHRDAHVFIVANDKFNLYPYIAELAKMTIVNTFRRPVLNRTERNKMAYAESIFHLRLDHG